MTWTNSIRTAVMAAVLASAGFGQNQTANQQKTGMTPTDPRALQQMDKGQQPGTLENAAPNYGREMPNQALSGNTPETNSTLQQGGSRERDFELGWLGLLGLAGLFGMGRGSVKHHDLHSRP